MRIDLSDDFLDLHLVGAERVLTGKRCLRLPQARIHRAFVLERWFAVSASPWCPLPGWSTRWSRVGVFGLGDRAQLWSVRSRPVVLALYLRGEPYHRVVCDVDDPVHQAASINRWLRRASTPRRSVIRTPSRAASTHPALHTVDRPTDPTKGHRP